MNATTFQLLTIDLLIEDKRVHSLNKVFYASTLMKHQDFKCKSSLIFFSLLIKLTYALSQWSYNSASFKSYVHWISSNSAHSRKV